MIYLKKIILAVLIFASTDSSVNCSFRERLEKRNGRCLECPGDQIRENISSRLSFIDGRSSQVQKAHSYVELDSDDLEIIDNSGDVSLSCERTVDSVWFKRKLNDGSFSIHLFNNCIFHEEEYLDNLVFKRNYGYTSDFKEFIVEMFIILNFIENSSLIKSNESGAYYIKNCFTRNLNWPVSNIQNFRKKENLNFLVERFIDMKKTLSVEKKESLLERASSGVDVGVVYNWIFLYLDNEILANKLLKRIKDGSIKSPKPIVVKRQTVVPEIRPAVTPAVTEIRPAVTEVQPVGMRKLGFVRPVH